MGELDPGGEFGDQFLTPRGAARVWQAEGVLMELLGVGPQQAGQLLRQFAADSGEALIDTATAIVKRRGLHH